MKPRGSLTIPTSGRFLWLKTQSGRPKSARGLFQQSPYVHASLWFHLSHRGEVGVQVSAGIRKALGQKAFASGVRLSAFH